MSSMGKWKTTFQLIATPMLMVYENFLGLPLALMGTVLMYFAAFLSLWSAILYSASMIKKMREVRREKKRLKQTIKD